MTVDEAQEHAVDGAMLDTFQRQGSIAHRILDKQRYEGKGKSTECNDDGVGGPCARVRTVFYPLDSG